MAGQVVKPDPGAIDPALARMLGWFLILAAIPAGYFAFARAYDKIASPTWPVAEAEIVRSSMYQRTGKSQAWCIKWSYRYAVDGTTHVSESIGVSRIGDLGCDRNKAVTAARLARLGPGARIRVHYRPGAPGDTAVILAGLDFLDYFATAVSLGMLVLGVSEVRKHARRSAPLA